MSKYAVDDSSLTAVADAIRAKGDTQAALTFPNGFVSAVNDIPTGVVTLKPFVIRPDAELVKTFSYDKYIVADEGVTIPAYTTTSKTLKASATLEETYTINYADYNWYVLIRALTIPEYSIATKAKGRDEYHFSFTMYEVTEIAAGEVKALLDPTKATTSRTASLVATGAFSRIVYWSSATAIGAYSTTTYGTVQSIVAPTLANSVITFNTPTFIVRGNTTYLVNTFMNALTDIRYQWVIEVYRAPKGNLNLDGWGQYMQAQHILDCVYSADHKLT